MKDGKKERLIHRCLQWNATYLGEETPDIISWILKNGPISQINIIDEIWKLGGLWYFDGKKKRRCAYKTSVHLSKGMTVYLHFDPRLNELFYTNFKELPYCVYADTGFGIWYKPFGLLSVNNDFTHYFTMINFLQKKIKGKIFPVHRLDRETKGLICFAYNKKAQRDLSLQWQARKVRKFYRALVWGKLMDNQSTWQSINYPIKNKESLTYYRIIEYRKVGHRGKSYTQTLVDIELKTGRFHQVRRHFSLLGHPLVGDGRYKNGMNEDLPEYEHLKLVSYKIILSAPAVEIILPEKDQIL